MTRRRGLWLHGALLVLLCGCDIHSDSPAAQPPAAGVTVESGWGLATPDQIGDFTRVPVDPPQHPLPGVTAGYTHILDSDAVIATMSVRPRPESDVLLPVVDLGGRGGVDAGESAKALAASIAQVRRFYPQAAVVAQGETYLVQRGALQNGQQALLEYRELHAGQQRKMRLHIYSFCCLGGAWDYEYRFRYPAAVDDDSAIDVFLRSSSWTAAPPS